MRQRDYHTIDQILCTHMDMQMQHESDQLRFSVSPGFPYRAWRSFSEFVASVSIIVKVIRGPAYVA